jgi:hypothetical protein
MKDFSSWIDAAAEEATKTAIKSSMDICSQMRKDYDNKEDVDHEKIDILHHCWETLHEISHVVSHGKTAE